jgi:SAM-dependent methyltransferase
VDNGSRGAAPTFGPRCFLCGAEDFAVFGEAPPARWVRCGSCGLVRQQEPPPASVTQRQYGFTPLHGGSPPERADTGTAPRPDPHVLFKHWVVGRALAAHGLTGRLVDIGCGNGLLQLYLRSLGWTDTVGVEPFGDPTGREQLGLEIHNEPVEGFFRRPGMAGGFDVAVAHHVIEHTYEPLEFADRLRELLRPGGHALVATPNIRGASMRWKTLASRLGWKARPFRHLDYPKHLVLFDPGTLERLFAAAGFEIVDLQTYTRASGDASARPMRFSAWDRLRLGDNMYVLGRRPAS